MLDAAAIELLCVPLMEAVRARRLVPITTLADATPEPAADAVAWLQWYGQLRAWLAVAPVADSEHASADARVMRAIREAPVAIAGTSRAVHAKSFTTYVQLHVLSLQLDRLTARLAHLSEDTVPLEAMDRVVDVATAVTYVQHLIAWIWLAPGPGMPFDAQDPAPVVPPEITALTPEDLLQIAQAIGVFAEDLAALQQLVSAAAPDGATRRPSWSGLFEAVGAEWHIDARELAVTHSLGKVLALTRLAADRLRVPEPAA